MCVCIFFYLQVISKQSIHPLHFILVLYAPFYYYYISLVQINSHNKNINTVPENSFRFQNNYLNSLQLFGEKSCCVYMCMWFATIDIRNLLVFVATLITIMGEKRIAYTNTHTRMQHMEKRFAHCLSLALLINRWIFTRFAAAISFFSYEEIGDLIPV